MIESRRNNNDVFLSFIDWLMWVTFKKYNNVYDHSRYWPVVVYKYLCICDENLFVVCIKVVKFFF